MTRPSVTAKQFQKGATEEKKKGAKQTDSLNLTNRALRRDVTLTRRNKGDNFTCLRFQHHLCEIVQFLQLPLSTHPHHSTNAAVCLDRTNARPASGTSPQCKLDFSKSIDEPKSDRERKQRRRRRLGEKEEGKQMAES